MTISYSSPEGNLVPKKFLLIYLKIKQKMKAGPYALCVYSRLFDIKILAFYGMTELWLLLYSTVNFHSKTSPQFSSFNLQVYPFFFFLFKI